MQAFSNIQKWAVRVLTELGDFMITSGFVLVACFTPPWRIWLVIQQMEFIGVGSILIIVLMSMFAGAVFTLQVLYALSMFSMESMVGATVALALTRELSPVLSALMITGRAGSAMATELGTMRVTEQIDALESMAVNPLQYLVVPRFIASLVMFPVLTMVSNLVGMFGSYVVGVIMWGIDPGNFIERIRWYVTAHDIYSGLMKSIVFGGVVTLVSCFKGYRAAGGARGVGTATTQAVVISSVSIMIVDYFLTVLMY
jgi:conserved hypothetical integral membrane protein